MSKRRIPWYWAAMGIVVIATNNVVQFVDNIKTGDMFVYVMIGVMAFVTARDMNLGGAFR